MNILELSIGIKLSSLDLSTLKPKESVTPLLKYSGSVGL